MDRLACTCIAIVAGFFFLLRLGEGVLYSPWNDIRFSWVMVRGLVWGLLALRMTAGSDGLEDIGVYLLFSGILTFVNPGWVFFSVDTFIGGLVLAWHASLSWIHVLLVGVETRRD